MRRTGSYNPIALSGDQMKTAKNVPACAIFPDRDLHRLPGGLAGHPWHFRNNKQPDRVRLYGSDRKSYLRCSCHLSRGVPGLIVDKYRENFWNKKSRR